MVNQQGSAPLVSVIVPIYNVEKYIHRCIESLNRQTLKELEIILVDDGSPDGCGEIIDGYAKQYANIVVVHKENGGLSDARNAGLKVARGQYIGFVDPDDYVEPDMFEKMYLSAKTNQSDLVFCGYNEVFSATFAQQRTFAFISEFKSAAEILSSCIQGNIGAYAWNKLYKTAIIQDNSIAFPKGINVVEDQVFFFAYIKHVHSFSVVPDCLYHYIRNNESICAKYHNRQLEFYKTGFAAIESALHYFEDIAPSLYIQNKMNMLSTLLRVLDMQASVRNKVSLAARYREMCSLIDDADLLKLIADHGDSLRDKTAVQKVKLIRAGKRKTLFLYEFFRMRIIERIKYYIG